MDVVGSQRDRSQEPAFKAARPGQTYFGPVYFRKETEPYMTIAVKAGGEAHIDFEDPDGHMLEYWARASFEPLPDRPSPAGQG